MGEWVRAQFAEQPLSPRACSPSALHWAACGWRLRMETSISGAEPSRLSLRWFGEYAELMGGDRWHSPYP